MLWAVPAKSPVAPRALAVLAFFLLLTLYLTWPRRCCTALAESEIRLWWWPRYVRA